MKKLLIALTGMLLGSGAYAQTIVDTTVQKRNVVVEEFTGVDCGYCPHGHQLVNELANSYPGRVVPINIHCGVYSSNTYTTPYGETLLSNTAYAGFPCGAINRKLSGCAVDAMNRSYFKSTGKSVLNQDSPVNIAATAKVNAETREMSIHIEVYYTKDVNQAYNLLNVALLQDKIIGKQSNYNQNNSEYITEDGQYMHMHMLRDLITGQWGAQIMSNEDSVIKAGSFLDTTIVYTIPKIISNEYVKFGNINLALFITDGYNLNCKNVKGPNIYTGISCTPEYTNLESLVDVVTDKIYITPQYGKGCNDLVNADILLTNNAGDVTSLTVEYGSLLTKTLTLIHMKIL